MTQACPRRARRSDVIRETRPHARPHNRGDVRHVERNSPTMACPSNRSSRMTTGRATELAASTGQLRTTGRSTSASCPRTSASPRRWATPENRVIEVAHPATRRKTGRPARLVKAPTAGWSLMLSFLRVLRLWCSRSPSRGVRPSPESSRPLGSDRPGGDVVGRHCDAARRSRCIGMNAGRRPRETGENIVSHEGTRIGSSSCARDG